MSSSIDSAKEGREWYTSLPGFHAFEPSCVTVSTTAGYACVMVDWITEDAGLAGLFFASFVAATIVPLSSEVVLFGFLKLHPHAFSIAVILATIGNTLGGMTTYLLGRLVHEPTRIPHLAHIRRYGASVLAFAWVPLVGDGLCLAAGWLRVNWLAAAIFQVAGRCLRYIVIAWLAVPSA